MAKSSKKSKQVSEPLHIENTVRGLGKSDLSINNKFHTYRDMMSDSQIGGALSLMQGLMNKLTFKISTERDVDKKVIGEIENSFYTMPVNFQQFMNYALSELFYGHSIFEKVYKRENGVMVVDVLSPIHPITVNKYVYNNLRLVELQLKTPDNDGKLIQNKALNPEIEGSKIVMFKLNADLDNPLGRSVLDRVYMDWKSKLIASEYELIGIAKNLSGVVKLEAPSEYIQDWYNNPTSSNALYVDSLLEQAELLHGGKSSVMMISSDTTIANARMFDVKQFGDGTSTNTFDIDKTINRFNNNILSSLYSDILSMGTGGNGGSFALSDNKTNLLGLFIESVLTTLTYGIEEVVDDLLVLNNKPNVKYEIEWEDVDESDLEQFGRAWARLGQSGLVQPTEELDSAIRKMAGVPKATKETPIDLQAKAGNERREDDKQQ